MYYEGRKITFREHERQVKSSLINKNLVNARKELGLSAYEAAQKIGISQSMLSMLEKKQRSGSDKTKLKIAKFYCKSIEELFYS